MLAAMGGKDRSKAPELLDLVGLGERGGDRFKEYSLGMKQRLGIAGALLGSPVECGSWLPVLARQRR